MTQLGYLASPYQHPDPLIRKKRLLAVTYVAAELFMQGRYVFSPLTHNVPLKGFGVLGDWDAWKAYDELLLSRCNILYVLQLAGWEQSKGVSGEIAFAKAKKIPITMLGAPEEKAYLNGAFIDALKTV